MGRYVFKYHNRIIHHHTDSDRKRRKRDDINRISTNSQVNERGNQRKRNGDTDNQCCTPTSQEKEHDDDNEEQGINNGFRQTVDGVQNVVGSIDNDTDLHVTRQVLLKPRQCVGYFLGDFYRIGSRLFLNNNHRTLHTIVIGFLCTFFHSIDDSGYITQKDICPIMCTYHYVCQLSGIIELTFYTQRVCFTTDIEVTTGNVLILGADNGTDCFDSQVIGFQFIGVAIDLNLTLRRTTDRHGSDSRNTCQRVYHTVVQYLIKG